MLNRSITLGTIFGILFCFDRLPIPFGPAVMPPIFIFTLLYCFVGLFKSFIFSQKAIYLLIFILFLIFYAFIIMLISGIFVRSWIIEFIEFIIKMVLVTSMLFCMSNIYLTTNLRKFFIGISIGVGITLFFATLHLSWIVIGHESLKAMVIGIRETVIPTEFGSGADLRRIASFSNEPSSFGALVFLFILPIFFLLMKNKFYQFYVGVLGFFSVSSTSVFSFLAGIIFSKNSVMRLSVLVTTILIFLYFFMSNEKLIQSNYALRSISIILENVGYALRVDARLGSSLFVFFEPISLMKIFGTGVGSIHHLGELRLSNEFWQNLLLVSNGVPNLKTFLGSMLFDFGILLSTLILSVPIGYLFFGNKKSPLAKYLIFGLISYSFFGFSYINPILWFWIITFCLIDIQYLQHSLSNRKYEKV